MEETTLHLSPKSAGSSRSPFGSDGSRNPIAEWTRVPARIRGARLFRFRRPDGGHYWEAEVMLNGKLVQRPFETELHARAWLFAAAQPHLPQDSFDFEELNGAFRAACFAHGT